MDHGRLPWLMPSELDERQRSVYYQVVGGPRAKSAGSGPSTMTDEEGRLHGPFNAMLFDPAVGEVVQSLGSIIRYGSQLSARMREITTLMVARAWRSNHEWHSHSRLGRAAGLSDEEIDAILNEEIAPSLSPEEQLAARVVRALLDEQDLDDTLYREAQPVLGYAVLTDIVVVVGYYELLARSLRVWRTPLPAGAEPRFGA